MLNTVRQGSAAVRRTSQANPMELLVSLIEPDPTADIERLFRRWFEEVRGDDEYLMAALRHTFTNLFSALERDKRSNAPLQDDRQRRINVARAKNKVVSHILLNMLLPNGKSLRDATFGECREAGGWFLRVADLGSPDEVVGACLTEDALRAL